MPRASANLALAITWDTMHPDWPGSFIAFWSGRILEQLGSLLGIAGLQVEAELAHAGVRNAARGRGDGHGRDDANDGGARQAEQGAQFAHDPLALEASHRQGLQATAQLGQQARLDARVGADEVRNTITNIVQILAQDGGFILSPSHAVQVDTQPENIVAVYEAAGSINAEAAAAGYLPVTETYFGPTSPVRSDE